MDKKYIGSSFSSFLEEENIGAEVEARAMKRILAWQLVEEMKRQNISKTDMARKMKTSRAAIDRLLDPDNSSLTLNNMEKAAFAINKKLRIELCDLHEA
jgi:antitoxin HicB